MFLISRAVGEIRRVQIPRDTCTRFGRYLYSKKLSWIIKTVPVIVAVVVLVENITKNDRCLFNFFNKSFISSFEVQGPKCGAKNKLIR